MTSPGTPRKHFSMLRGFHLADFFTLGNAACGVGAVFLAMLYLASGDLAHFLASGALGAGRLCRRRAGRPERARAPRALAARARARLALGRDLVRGGTGGTGLRGRPA